MWPSLAQQPERLGQGVNTEAVELMPFVTADGQELYFVRARHPRNLGHRVNPEDQDIYLCPRQGDGWGPSLNIGPPVNNYYPNAHLAITPDGNTLMLMGVYVQGGRVLLPGFSYSLRTAGGWGMPRPLHVRNYRNLDPEWYTGYLAADGQTLLLGIEDSTSLGGLDLYASFRLPDSSYSQPLNLGPQINSPGREVSAFLAPDNQTLYFASEGRSDGHGSFDLYMSRRLDDSWTHWSQPLNLGPPLNTPGFEAYPSIAARGSWLYYVHSDSAALPDIYRMALPDTLLPTPTLLVHGTVRDLDTGLPLQAEIVYADLQTGTPAGMARSRPGTGAYQVALPPYVWYGLSAQAPGYYPLGEELDLHLMPDTEPSLQRDLYLQRVQPGRAIALRNVFFGTDSTDLRPESRAELDRLVQLLAAQPSWRIRVTGHTDELGSEDYNRRLSLGRANAVCAYLLLHGIAAARVEAEGMGEAQPLQAPASGADRAANRRVEFTVLE